MKDEFGRQFGKKEFFETLIVVVVTLFLIGIGNLIPSLFPFILLVLGVALIVVFIDSRIKSKKLNEESKKNK